MVTEALRLVNQGMSQKQASEQTGVPWSTLINKIKNRYPPCKHKTVLSKIEEMKLATWIKRLAIQRLGRTAHNICTEVQKVLNARRPVPKTVFKDNKPGRTWLKRFISRHPDTRKRRTKLLDPSQAAVSKEYLMSWFKEVESLECTAFWDKNWKTHFCFQEKIKGFLF